MSERESFRQALARFERELGKQIDQLADDAQRLRARGHRAFAVELLNLRYRLTGIRRYAAVVLGPASGGSSPKAPPLPTADVCKPQGDGS